MSPERSAPDAPGAPGAPSRTRRSDAVLAFFTRRPGGRPAWVSWAPIAVVAFLIAWRSIAAILAKVGHPAAALDDSYIHFQYARAIAEGHPFRFEAGEPATMGATSGLWPLMLAPFYAMGCQGPAILWPAWVISFVALALLAREVALVTRPLAGDAAAMGAAWMTLSFSAFTWCAGSGMEVVPFAFLLVRTVRRSAEWVEAQSPTPRDEVELVALAFLAPLMRPEGALVALVAAAALLSSVRRRRGRAVLAAALALLAAITPQLLCLAVTGALQSNTAQVKLLPGNPYYQGHALVAVVRENLRTLLYVLLNGENWSAEFIPRASMPFAIAGLVSAWWCSARRGLRFRAAAVIALAVAIAAPCFYVSFLWNRLRYLWPFAPFWIVGLACLARGLGDALAQVRPRWRVTTPIAAGLVAGLFASKLDGTIDDLAMSASGIDRQQAAIGTWARSTLPAGARIGVNDTGAIAYFGDHPTFDVVGLTTNGEGRYWVAGAASRFEHYEALRRTSPASLPAYYIVYPDWMALEPVLGTRLHDATVTDSTILGGQTMVAYEADYSLLGSGELPWTQPVAPGSLLDSVDVADLESEAAHAYDLLGAEDGDEVVTKAASPSGAQLVDGGRRERSRDRFVVRLGLPGVVEAIARLDASVSTEVRFSVDGQLVAPVPVVSGGWTEVRFSVPHTADRTTIEVVPQDGTLATYHYWFFAGAPPRLETEGK